MGSLPVIFDKVKEHIWRDFGPFFLAYPFKIIHILGFVLINLPLQQAHRFSIGLRSGDWDGHCWTLILLSHNYFCVDLLGMLWVIVLLQSPPTVKYQPSGRGNHIFSQNCLILGGIHYAINRNQCPGPQNMTDPPTYFTVGMRCFSLYASLYLRQTCRCCTWQKNVGLIWPEHLVPVIM